MPRSRLVRSMLFLLVLAVSTSIVTADPNDWISVDYVAHGAKGADTSAARQRILSMAGSTASKGPWTVTSKAKVPIKPPSGDVRDYLSWAPYHWPDCNWCSTGSNHLSGPRPGNSTGDNDPEDDSSPKGDNSDLYGGNDPYDGGEDYSHPYSDFALSLNVALRRESGDYSAQHGRKHHRMMRRRRQLLDNPAPQPASRVESGSRAHPTVAPRDDGLSVPTYPDTNPAPALPTAPPDVGSLPVSPGLPPSSTTWGTLSGSPAPAAAPAKTQKGSKCTPSPAKMAPSATWTTCPYAVRDGKVNPDVRTLPDSASAVAMAQAILYNAIAFAIQKTTKAYSQNTAKIVDAFFLSPTTGMNPNMNFGQQVRGPGKDHQMGTWTGILDMRGLVKVVNGLKVLKEAGSPDWSQARDTGMTNWMRSYASWLENSALGKQVAKKANNHVSFYVSQLAAAKMYLGDTQGAQTALQNYFTNQFKDQIAQSGEQPFEAVRTRPYHYRCFNLEAMITNAKLGDQLGMDFWSAKSKYGATIQTALDYIMSSNPKNEDVSDIFPHVAAVAAAYGDPQGKYVAFLRQHQPDYAAQTYWYYDQPTAFTRAPGAKSKSHRRSSGSGIESVTTNVVISQGALQQDAQALANMTVDSVASAEGGQLPFVCPDVFSEAKETELEDGLFVNCDELRPYYEIAFPVDPAAL